MKVLYSESGRIIDVVDDNVECSGLFFTITEQTYDTIKNSIDAYRVNPNNQTLYMKPTCPDIFIKIIDNVWIEMTEEEKQQHMRTFLTALITDKIKQLQSRTYNYICEHMPDWRLNRWKSYYNLSIRLQNQQPLNELEQMEYDSFPDPGETHSECMQYVPIALSWVIAVINYNNSLVEQYFQCTSLEDIQNIEVTYPVWPLPFD